MGMARSSRWEGPPILAAFISLRSPQPRVPSAAAAPGWQRGSGGGSAASDLVKFNDSLSHSAFLL